MLKADVDFLKELVRKKDFEQLKGREFNGRDMGHLKDFTLPLINLCAGILPDVFKMSLPVALKSGRVVEKEFINYDFSIEQVVEIIKENRKKLLSAWG